MALLNALPNTRKKHEIKCTQASTISPLDNENVISDDSELAKSFTSYFKQ